MNSIKTDTDKARMLGKSTRFACGCCSDDDKVPSRRASRRRERQDLRKFLSTF